MSHYFAHRLGPKHELPGFLARHIPGHDWSPTWSGKVPVHGVSTVQAAITAIARTETFAELLKYCVSYTGDVDSVATIACACASSDRSFRDVPDALWMGLEQSDYGLDYLIELDRKVRLKTYQKTAESGFLDAPPSFNHYAPKDNNES